MRRVLLLLMMSFIINIPTYAICIKNETRFKLYYEIHNRNVDFPIPEVKFYNGLIEPLSQRCHAHSSQGSDDWKIFRKDLIKVYKVLNNKNVIHACSRTVEGVLNTLNIIYYDHPDKWWCRDKYGK